MNDERDASTAEALIQAARRLFTLHGYDGTSVRAITADAAANLGAITYHFGSKRELYDHVVGSAVRPLAERIEAAVAQAAPVPARVEAVVRTWFDYLAGNPDLPQLMLQELLLAESPPEVVAVPLRRVHVALTGLVEEGQSAGVIRAGPARVLGIFILSVPVHLGILHRAMRAQLGIDLLEPRTFAGVVESAVAFVRGGLAVPSREEATP